MPPRDAIHPAEAMPVRWRAPTGLWPRWRDRLLADARFQRWAARFFLTRPIARRESRALFDICAGFVYAQVLAACVELDIFTRLAAGPLPSATLARACDLPAPAMELLLDAAVTLRLLERRRGGIGLGPLGAALRGNPGIAAMVAHHRLFYADVADPVALLRGRVTTQLSQFWPYRGQAGDAAAYTPLMAATQPMIAGEILAAYDVSAHRLVLDIGGGDGSFLCHLAAQAPAARLQLFELPPIAEQAIARFDRAGLAARAAVFAGDFLNDPLPSGADLITLVRVLHDHDDAPALKFLSAVRRILPAGGKLLLAEPMADTKGAEPVGAAYFGFYLLAMGSGRPRRFADIENLLIQAGFSRVRRIPTSQPLLTSLLLAEA
jgi:demethylspheroidene O-methyltransferase